MNFFLTMVIIACVGLFFFTKDSLTTGIVCMIIACVGFWSSLVYYNSYLPEIAAPEDRDRVSAKGFAYGYIGSVILQVICFVFVMKPEIFGLDKDSTTQYRLCFLLVGIWYFAQISLICSIITRSHSAVLLTKQLALVSIALFMVSRPTTTPRATCVWASI